MRYDELPYSAVQSFGVYEQTDPAELTSACYETAAKADAAYARYVADPKSLRTSCTPQTEWAEEPQNPEMCTRYAQGVDVFAEMRAESTAHDKADRKDAEDACNKEAQKKHKNAAQAGAAAARCAATSSGLLIAAPPPVERR